MSFKHNFHMKKKRLADAAVSLEITDQLFKFPRQLSGFAACLIITYQKLMAAFHDQDGVEFRCIFPVALCFPVFDDDPQHFNGVVECAESLNNENPV